MRSLFVLLASALACSVCVWLIYRTCAPKWRTLHIGRPPPICASKTPRQSTASSRCQSDVAGLTLKLGLGEFRAAQIARDVDARRCWIKQTHAASKSRVSAVTARLELRARMPNVVFAPAPHGRGHRQSVGRSVSQRGLAGVVANRRAVSTAYAYAHKTHTAHGQCALCVGTSTRSVLKCPSGRPSSQYPSSHCVEQLCRCRLPLATQSATHTTSTRCSNREGARVCASAALARQRVTCWKLPLCVCVCA